MPRNNPSDEQPSRLALGLALLGAGLIGSAFVGGSLWVDVSYPSTLSIEDLVKNRFPAIFGLPTAAITAFCLVVFLRQTSGPIKFEAFGIKLHGAAGPVILWLICFLAIVAAIKALY